MASFDLDFHRQRQGQPRLGWVLVLAGLLSAGMAAYFTMELERKSRDLGELKSQLAASEQLLQERSIVVETPEQVAMRERLGSWSANALTPMRVVEANWSKKLAMSQLSLTRDESAMVIEFEASSIKEGMDLHRRLVRSGYFRGVKLLRHSITVSGGASVVLMAIELQWGNGK